MGGRKEQRAWVIPTNPEHVTEIREKAEALTDGELEKAVKEAIVAALAGHTKAKEHCDKMKTKCLPYTDFLTVALKDKMRELLGVPMGSVKVAAFNEWYSANKHILQRYIDHT